MRHNLGPCLLAGAAVLGGCTPQVSPQPPGDRGAGGTAGDALPGDARAGDRVAADGPTGDGRTIMVPTIGDRVEIERRDGSTASGELIARYDHSLWWDDPSDTVTHALFDHAALQPYPDDSSLILVPSGELLTLTATAWDPATPTYREELRARGIGLAQPPLAGVSYVITGHDSYHLEENGYGDFAWDFEITDSAGARFSGAGTANADFLVWDAEVFLPTTGYVVEVIRNAPDNPLPGSYPDGAVNNLVGVQLYGSYYLYLLHFRQDTIPLAVAVGETLSQGTYLGRVGNAGVSLEPHLHVTLLWWDGEADSPRYWSVPAQFRDVYWATSPTGPAALAEHYVPESGVWVSAGSF